MNRFHKSKMHPIDFILLNCFNNLDSFEFNERVKKELDLIDKNSIPRLPQETKNSSEITNYLKSINYNLLVNFEELENVIQEQKQTTIQYSMYIYLSAISFIYINDPSTLDSSCIPNIIDMILIGLYNCLSNDFVNIDITEDNEKKISSVQNPFLNENNFLFHNLMSVIFSKTPKYEPMKFMSKESFKIIINYFDNDNCRLDVSFSLTFYEMFKFVFRNNEPENLQNSFLRILLLCLQNKKKFFDYSEYRNKILKFLFSYSDFFSNTVLSIIAWMSKNAKSQKLNSNYNQIPKKIITFISNTEFDLEYYDQLEINQTITIPKNLEPINKYSFITKVGNSFPNGITTLPDIFFQNNEALVNIFDKNIKRIIPTIIDFLNISDEAFIPSFFEVFKESLLSLQQDKKFIFYYAFYLILLKNSNIVKTLLKLQLELLKSHFIFNPNHLIFIKGSLNPLINCIRNEIFYLILENDINQLSLLFDIQEPLLSSEHIGRIISIYYQLDNKNSIHQDQGSSKNSSILYALSLDKQFCNNVMSIAKTLLLIDIHNHSDIIAQSRNCVFLLIFSLLQYDNNLLASFIFDFLFENELTDIIIHVLEKYIFNQYSYDVFKEFANVLSSCEKKIKADKNHTNHDYPKLVLKLSNMVLKCLQSNPKNSTFFIPIFELILKNFLAFQSFELLNTILLILIQISNYNPHFCIKAEYINFISIFIKQKVDDNIYNSLYTKFLCLLKNSSQYIADDLNKKNSQIFLIERPQFIPFFVASYGSSSFFGNGILQKFIDCCKISYSNIIQLHIGHFDTILLMFLRKKSERTTFMYNGIEIELKISLKNQKLYLFPLLQMMLSFISSYSVNSLFLDLFTNEAQNSNNIANVNPIFRTFLKSLTLGNILSIPSITISPFCKYLCNTSIKGSFFKQSFTIAFWMRLDVLSLIKHNSSIEILTISDSKYSKVIILFTKGMIVFRYDSYQRRTQVKLIEIPCFQWKDTRKETIDPSSYWHSIIITFENKNQKVSLTTNLDSEKDIKAEMVPITLQDEILQIKVGTTKTNNVIERFELGSIAFLKLFPRKLTEIEKYDFFSSRNKNIKNEIILDLYPKFNGIWPKNISLQFENQPLLQKLLNVFAKTKSFEFLSSLKLIFEASNTTQKKFDLTLRLADIISNISANDESFLNINLYYILYSIYEIITYLPLKYAFLQEILMNIKIWNKSKSFNYVIQQWIDVLIPNNQEFFKNNNVFDKYLREFDLYIISSEYSALFLKFLQVISVLNFEVNNSIYLLSYCFAKNDEAIQLLYLNFLLNIHSIIFESHKQTYIEYLHFTIKSSRNKKIIFKSIQLIYLFSGNNIYRDLLIIAYSIQDILKEDNSKYRELVFSILNKLNKTIDFYPNFYALIAQLSIILENESICDNVANLLYQKRMKLNIYTNDIWFLWPIILLYYVSSYENASKIFNFLAYHSRNSVENIITISHLITLLTSSVKTEKSFNLNWETYINEFYEVLTNNESNPTIYSELLNLCIFNTFWHLNVQQPNRALQSLMMQSSFSKLETYELTSPLKLDELKDIQFLVRHDIKYTFHYQVNVKEDSHSFSLENQKLIDISKYFREKCLNSENRYYDIINYFSSKHEKNVLFPFEDILYPMKSEFEANFNKIISALFNKIKGIFDAIDVYFENMSTIKLYEKKLEIQTSNNEKKAIDNDAPLRTQTKYGYLIRNCPFKIKQNQDQKFKTKRLFNYSKSNMESEFSLHIKKDQNIYEAKWIRINKEKDIKIQITNTNIIIFNNEKIYQAVEMNEIKTVFLMSPIEIEILLENNESYFISFNITVFNEMSDIILYFKQNNKLNPLFSFSPFLKTIQSAILNDKTGSSKIINTLCFENELDFKSYNDMSNFDVLILINYLNGRSFNNIHNYPIFPQFFKKFDPIEMFSVDEFEKIQYSAYELYNNIHGKYYLQQININEIVKYDSVPPEFYFVPELIDMNQINITDASGHKINSEYEFCSMMRAFLESRKGMEYILHWCQKNFPMLDCTSKLFDYRNLFNFDIKNILFKTKTEKTEKAIFDKIELNGPLVFSAFNQINGWVLVDSKYIYFSIGRKADDKYLKYPLNEDLNLQYAAFFVNNDGVYVFDRINMMLSLYTTANDLPLFKTKPRKEYNEVPIYKFEQQIFCETSIFSASNHDIFYCQTDSEIKSIRKDITIFSDEQINLISTSTEFGIIAFSTYNNHFYLYSIIESHKQESSNQAILLREKQFKDPILFICISKSSGNIFLCTKTIFISFTINGSKIKKCYHENDFLVLCPITTHYKGDYIAFIDVDHNFGYIDASFSFSVIRIQMIEDAVNIDYDASNSQFIIFKETGKIEFFPFYIDIPKFEINSS